MYLINMKKEEKANVVIVIGSLVYSMYGWPCNLFQYFIYISYCTSRDYVAVPTTVWEQQRWSQRIYIPRRRDSNIPSSYKNLTHPTSPCLLCRQLYRRTGSAVNWRQSGERLGESNVCKTIGCCCPFYEWYVYSILWVLPYSRVITSGRAKALSSWKPFAGLFWFSALQYQVA